MPARVVVLGGGVGGTLVANLLDKALGRDVHVTVVDPTGMHDYQPGYLYVALGQAKGHWLSRAERSLLRTGVDLAIEEAIRIHPDAGTVQLARGGSLEWDYLVVATGARLVPHQIPGLVDESFEFYSLAGAERLGQELRRFRGGRIKVGIAGIPYKCPPAPVEFTFMVDGYLREHDLRDRSEVELLSPLNRAFTIESASKLIQPIMERRGIGLTTFFNVESVDPSAHTVESLEGEKQDYDLLVLVPPHEGAEVVKTSGLGDPSGWLPTDRATLNVDAPAYPAQAQSRVARREMALQPPVLGDRAAGPSSRAGAVHHTEGGSVMSSTIAKVLDMRGYSCPLPIAKTALAIRELSVGDLIEVLATDPGSVPDFAAWSTTTGHELVERTEADGVYRFVIRKTR